MSTDKRTFNETFDLYNFDNIAPHPRHSPLLYAFCSELVIQTLHLAQRSADDPAACELIVGNDNNISWKDCGKEYDSYFNATHRGDGQFPLVDWSKYRRGEANTVAWAWIVWDEVNNYVRVMARFYREKNIWCLDEKFINEYIRRSRVAKEG